MTDIASEEDPIVMRGLTRYFGTRKVVDQVSLTVPVGSVFALLGRNGSGKSTAIRMLLGLIEPTRGESAVLGCDSRELTPAHRARIGYLAESHPVYKWMTVRESHEHQARFHERWDRRVFESIADHFRLDPSARAGNLSRGERAGLALAMVLATDPEVLILDDPALGLDPVARRWLLESLVLATNSQSRTIFFSSHLLDDVERVADHVAILDRSVLRVACTMEAFREHVRHFVLRFVGNAPPANLPEIGGVLRVRRFASDLHFTIADPDDVAIATLNRLGAASVEEVQIGFDDAVVGYLGDNGSRNLSFDWNSGLTGSHQQSATA